MNFLRCNFSGGTSGCTHRVLDRGQVEVVPLTIATPHITLLVCPTLWVLLLSPARFVHDRTSVLIPDVPLS